MFTRRMGLGGQLASDVCPGWRLGVHCWVAACLACHRATLIVPAQPLSRFCWNTWFGSLFQGGHAKLLAQAAVVSQ